MITENHWLLTTMNGEARYEKPPFPSWIGAILEGYLASQMFGHYDSQRP